MRNKIKAVAFFILEPNDWKLERGSSSVEKDIKQLADVVGYEIVKNFAVTSSVINSPKQTRILWSVCNELLRHVTESDEKTRVFIDRFESFRKACPANLIDILEERGGILDFDYIFSEYARDAHEKKIPQIWFPQSEIF